ncbi:MAG: T9SS type A sorting domain-containing protein [Bacteroidota bacterium]
MKKLITLLLFTLPVLLIAQTTYNASDYGDEGDNFLLSQATFIPFFTDFGDTGANFNWDYSDLNIISQANREFLDPGDTGYFGSYFTSCLFDGNGPFTCTQMWNDLTDFGVQELDEIMLGQIELSNVINLMRKTNSALEATILGVTVGTDFLGIPLAIAYDGADLIYQFPLNYNDTYSSTSSWDFDLNDLGQDLVFKASQTRTSNVEGWGSLTTPYTTFPSVLKVKSVIQNNDTLFTNGIALPLPTTEVEYTWLDPNFGIPVLKATGNEVFGNDVITSVEFLDTLRCLSPNPFFFAQPPVATIDATTGTAEVTFNNLSQNADTYTWDFGDQTMSNDATPVHEYTSAGLYTVSLEACNTSCDMPTCENFTFVVLVNDPVVSTYEVTGFEGVDIYPNPVDDYFILDVSNAELAGKEGVVEILDIQGRLIQLETTVLQAESRIDLNEAAAGVYVVRLVVGEDVISGKFLRY